MNCFFLKWGLPNDQFLLLAALLIMSDTTSAYITAPLERVCTRDEDLSNEYDLHPDSNFFLQRSMVLEGSGARSAALLLAKMSDPPCALVVEAPRDTHAITISLSNFPKSIPCPLSLWFHDTTGKNETWFLDLCDREKWGILALYPEVYPHRITLRWNAKIPQVLPKNDSGLMKVLSSEEPIEIVVTAVARGPLCNEETRVLCWKMKKESLCVSEEFACDGKNNCPRPWNEESKSMCPQRRNDHLKRILAVRSGDREGVNSGDRRATRRNGADFGSGRLSVGGATSEHSNEEGESTEKEDGEVKRSGILGALPQLGPGSYVLMGMLVCGSVLLLCGIWECCCRVRNRPTTISVSQRGSLVTNGPSGQGTTTTVVIISSTPPPQYDDLEQPPNYKELFPARTKTTVG
ncbi:uncharacterized protein [Hetaerina americana]|uniref:uncharacterized protein isoform X2 n=1 Tax=Hetaerina americana TaxID=62018 RepID=UPI003A7F5A8F